MKVIRYLIYVIVILTSCSCERKHSTTYIPWCKLAPMDSARTEHQIDNIISGWYIDEFYEDLDHIKGLDRGVEMRMLPYYYQMFITKTLPSEVSLRFSDSFGYLCTLYDPNLLHLYDTTIDRIKKNVGQLYVDKSAFMGFFNDTTKDKYKNYADIDGERMSVDSLRIRVVAYNDRNALGKLERYYHDRNEPRELAIYYQVLLNYDGNGDLAERFYYVLRPYLKEKAQYLNGIHEVLLRAALCDHNERAQELCDSLGFSLCDYKIPVPCHDGDNPNREFISGHVGDVDFFEEDTPDDYDD